MISYVVEQKSPMKKKLDEVIAIKIKSKLTLPPVTAFLAVKFVAQALPNFLAKCEYIGKDMPSLYPVLYSSMKQA